MKNLSTLSSYPIQKYAIKVKIVGNRNCQGTSAASLAIEQRQRHVGTLKRTNLHRKYASVEYEPVACSRTNTCLSAGNKACISMMGVRLIVRVVKNKDPFLSWIED